CSTATAGKRKDILRALGRFGSWDQLDHSMFNGNALRSRRRDHHKIGKTSRESRFVAAFLGLRLLRFLFRVRVFTQVFLAAIQHHGRKLTAVNQNMMTASLAEAQIISKGVRRCGEEAVSSVSRP